MDIGGLGIAISIPVCHRRKDDGACGHAEHGADDGVMLLGIQFQRLAHLLSGQILHTEDPRLQRMAARVNGDGRYLIHVNMNASFARNSQWNMQSFAHHSVMHAGLRRAVLRSRRNSRGSCGGISYRGGERAGVF